MPGAAVAAAAAGIPGSRYYNPYHYDQTVPQFTPDGRLLQVEYASAAADHSAPIVFAPLRVPRRRRQPHDKHDKHDKTPVEYDDQRILMALRPSRRHAVVQERLVLLNDHCGGGDVVVVALTGVLADSLALLQRVQTEGLRHKQFYGGHPPSAWQSIAATLSQACQEHAMGGGIRPYGATFVICGREPLATTGNKDNENHYQYRIRMQQTDPSGGVIELDFKNRGQTADVPILIGGGSFLSGYRDLVQRRLTNEWETIQNSVCVPKNHAAAGDGATGRAITKLAEILLTEYHKQKKKDSSKDQQQAQGQQQQDDDDDDDDDESPMLEIVVVSSDRGVYKLSQAQIQAILAKHDFSINSSSRRYGRILSKFFG